MDAYRFRVIHDDYNLFGRNRSMGIGRYIPAPVDAETTERTENTTAGKDAYEFKLR